MQPREERRVQRAGERALGAAAGHAVDGVDRREGRHDQPPAEGVRGRGERGAHAGGDEVPPQEERRRGHARRVGREASGLRRGERERREQRLRDQRGGVGRVEQPRGVQAADGEGGGEEPGHEREGGVQGGRVGRALREQAPAAHGAPRAEEGVGLVERVRGEVQQRQRPRAEAALHEHDPHLRAGGPRQRDLHAHPRGADQRGEDRGAEPHEQQPRAGLGGGVDERGHAEQQHAADVHHPGVEQGRHGGGRLHDLGEPAVEGHLRAAHRGGDGEEHRGGAERGGGGGGGAGERVEVGGAEGAVHQPDGAPEQQVAGAAQQELLVRGDARGGAVVEVQQQRVEGEAEAGPPEGEGDEVAGEGDAARGPEGGEERAGVGALPGVAAEIAPREAGDGQAEGAHEREEHQGDRVDAQRERRL
ncbi:MAG: hypothetical protein U0325_15160 [Polyangiales bacterium]